MLPIRKQKSVNRPSDQNVCFDTARIFDQILKQPFDESHKKYHKVRRIRTDVEKASNHIDMSENVTRSKSLPTNYREALKEEHKPSEMEVFQDKIHQDTKPQDVDFDDLGSSADTEENPSLLTEKRKKKSFLKRAKERIIFTFQRNQKSGSGKVKEKNNFDMSNSKPQKNGDIHSKSRNVKGLIQEQRFVYTTQRDTYSDKIRNVSTHVPSGKKERGNFWNSFRKSKRLSQVTGDEYLQRNFDGRLSESLPKRPSVNDSNATQWKAPMHVIGLRSAVDNTLSHRSSVQNDIQSQDRHLADRSPSSTDGAVSSLRTIVPSPGKSTDTIISDKMSSSSNDILPLVNINQAQALTLNVASFKNNSLDCPGEDIQFIDASDFENNEKHGVNDHDNQEKHFQKDIAMYSGKKDLPNMKFPASQTFDSVNVPDFKKSVNLMRGIHGSTGATNIKTTTVISSQDIDENFDVLDGSEDMLDGVYDVLDGNDVGLDAAVNELPIEPQNPGADREAMYSLIAQKLIDMANSIPASEYNERPKSIKAESQNFTTLEKRIAECVQSLKNGTDKQMRQDIYRRLYITMQNSLGNDVNWNLVAFLFHAAKIVIKGLGTGSREAQEVRNFTLQYVNDTFASWITDQGGFDSLMSSEESDFGVD